jgi:hypothetical protein
LLSGVHPQKTHLPAGFDMKKSLEETKKLMASLLGMKPKPHEDMKLGKRKGKKKKSPMETKNATKPK